MNKSRWMRIIYLAEMIGIVLGLFLGAVWPSLFTVVALVSLPAFFIAAVALARPSILASQGTRDPRQSLRRYVHFSAFVSVTAVLYWTGRMAATHNAPVDIIVPAGLSGPVRILFAVSGGVPASNNGRRSVFEIPPERILVSEARRDDGWWRNSELRFFARDNAGLQEIRGKAGSAGTEVVGTCAVSYEDFSIEPRVKTPQSVFRELDDRSVRNLKCEGGRITRR
jgi:hypothetical protein